MASSPEALHFDTAVVGTNSQSAVAQRFLRAEVEHRNKQATLPVLWDVGAFADSMSTPQVIEDARSDNIPPLQAAYAAQMFRALRVITRHGAFSQPRRDHVTSVVAGMHLIN